MTTPTFTINDNRTILCPLCEKTTRLSADGRVRQHWANARNICALSNRHVELLAIISPNMPDVTTWDDAAHGPYAWM